MSDQDKILGKLSDHPNLELLWLPVAKKKMEEDALKARRDPLQMKPDRRRNDTDKLSEMGIEIRDVHVQLLALYTKFSDATRIVFNLREGDLVDVCDGQILLKSEEFRMGVELAHIFRDS